MKSINLFQAIAYLIILLAIMSSCEVEDELEGNGKITTQRHAIQEFSNLKIDGVLNVYFEQSDNYKVEVKTDENLQGIVQVVNEGETLKIYTDSQDDFEASEMDIYVTAPTVSDITLNGVTALYIKKPLEQSSFYLYKQNTGYVYLNAHLKKFSLLSDGVGDVNLVGKAGTTFIDNSMIGDINAFKYITENLTLTHNGTGTIEITVLSSLQVELLGVGDIYCKGSPDNISKSGNGIGRIYMVD